MIRSQYVANDGKLHTDLKIEQLAQVLKSKYCFLWVDFSGEPPSVDEPILKDVFGFHPLAVDDALQENHVPKVDDWDTYLYIVLHSIFYTEDQVSGSHLDTYEVDVFLGKNYIVTHHDQQIAALERVWNTLPKDGRYTQHGADHLLYRLSDELIVDYMNVVEKLDDEIEAIEDVIFEKPSPQMLEHTFALKRSIVHLRRILSPLREVFNKLARDDFDVVDAKDRIYFRDVYDHLVRLYDISESLRDLVSGVLDTYLSVINNRMNDIMKTLTVITTIFMPISFITGFFGMNFFQPVAQPLAAWTKVLPFIIMMCIIVAIPVSMLFWMRRRGWL